MFAANLYSTLMARENTVTIVGRKSGVNTIVNTTTAAKMNMTLLYLILKLKKKEARRDRPSMTIEEVVKEAEKEGLTYGKYVAKYGLY